MSQLRLAGLRVSSARGTLVAGVDLELRAGEMVGLVGASGSGKTLTLRALLGMAELHPGVVEGTLRIACPEGNFAPALSGTRGERDRNFADIRGTILGYLPQDARHALDPLLRIHRQVTLAGRPRTLRSKAPEPLRALEEVGFDQPARVARLYPHQLSGGMAQRVVIAQALARGSRFLLADEPTSGLDPEIAARILALLRGLADAGVGVLWVTHDMRLLTQADRVVVMAKGKVVERLKPTELQDAKASATRELLTATARIAGGALG